MRSGSLSRCAFRIAFAFSAPSKFKTEPIQASCSSVSDNVFFRSRHGIVYSCLYIHSIQLRELGKFLLRRHLFYQFSDIIFFIAVFLSFSLFRTKTGRARRIITRRAPSCSEPKENQSSVCFLRTISTAAAANAGKPTNAIESVPPQPLQPPEAVPSETGVGAGIDRGIGAGIGVSEPSSTLSAFRGYTYRREA